MPTRQVLNRFQARAISPRRLYEYDLIGLGSAVFGGQLGSLAIFLKNLRFVGGKHAFFFCTHGSAIHGGDFFPNAYKRAEKSGLVIIGTGDWYGDCYLLHMPEPYPTAGHPDEIDLREAEEFGREMVMRSWKISSGEKGLIPPTPELIPMKFDPEKERSEGNHPAIPNFADVFKYHKEKCLYPKCRLCMDNCPMGGIDLSVDPPVIAKPCLSCEFCAKLCPTGALDMNEWLEAMIAGMGQHFPHIFLPPLEKAEKEKLFRKLVPFEKIDLNVTGYTLHKKHPQWIIGKGRQ
jgi:ferredoxin